MKSREAIPRRLCLMLACGALLAACASGASPTDADGATFLVVRHAEKENDHPRDPDLSAVGRAHAQALARGLAHAHLVAIYATPYRRTRQTAGPAAEAHGLTVTEYDAATPAPDFAARLRRDVVRGGALVVGHGNTVPAIVAALCGCRTPSIAEDDYGDVYRVHIDPAGRARMTQERY